MFIYVQYYIISNPSMRTSSSFCYFYLFSLLANVIMWNVVRGLIHTLPAAFRDANAKYFKDYFKIDAPSRWKKCCTLTDNAFQYATTLLYANEHLSEESLETVSNNDNHESE